MDNNQKYSNAQPLPDEDTFSNSQFVEFYNQMASTQQQQQLGSHDTGSAFVQMQQSPTSVQEGKAVTVVTPSQAMVAQARSQLVGNAAHRQPSITKRRVQTKARRSKSRQQRRRKSNKSSKTGKRSSSSATTKKRRPRNAFMSGAGKSSSTKTSRKASVTQPTRKRKSKTAKKTKSRSSSSRKSKKSKK